MKTLFGEVEEEKPWNKLEALFASQTPDWSTPESLYAQLDAEFHFDFDPCPLKGADGLIVTWSGKRVYCNPPYGPGIDRWLRKARESEIAVYLLPARTDTKWWHELAMQADEIRFVKGRLTFGDADQGAPFPSVILVYKRKVS